MLEKEIKILDINKEEIIQKIKELWWEKTFEWYIHDIYYDFCSDWYQKMDENDRLFRVRKKWETHLYTIKRKRNTKKEWGTKWLKVADEWENPITDIDSFEKVLEKYWMQKIREKKKYRTSLKLWDIEFDIDEYEGIPPLLEIEAVTKKEIKGYIKKLWLENNPQKKFGSRWLFEYYKKEYIEFNK